MFDLPPRTALRCEQSAPGLRDHVASYLVLDSEVGGQATSEWMLPSWAQIWIVLTDEPVRVSIGNRRYDRIPPAVLYGVTSRAMPVSAHGGVTIGIDITPLGWARLFSRSAEKLRDRITPLEEVMPAAWVQELATTLRDSARALEVKGLLDGFFAQRLPEPHPDEPIIREIMALISDGNNSDLAGAAAALGIEARSLRRLTKQHFGFPPKILMMRTRFLQAFVELLSRGKRDGLAAVPATYHDTSHFIRDGKRFLGVTPRQFMALDTPYLLAALRARALVLGAATPTLEPAA